MAWGAIAPQAILNIRLCSILETKVGEGLYEFSRWNNNSDGDQR